MAKRHRQRRQVKQALGYIRPSKREQRFNVKVLVSPNEPGESKLDHKNFISYAEAGRAIGKCRQTIRNWAETGRLPMVISPAGKAGVFEEDLKEVYQVLELEPILTFTEAGKLTNRSKQSIANLVHQKYIPSVRHPSGVPGIFKADLEKVLEVFDSIAPKVEHMEADPVP